MIEAGGGSVISKPNKDSLKNKKDKIITLVCNETAHNKPQFEADLSHAKRLLNPNKIYQIELILDSCEQQEFDLTKHRVATAAK